MGVSEKLQSLCLVVLLGLQTVAQLLVNIRKVKEGGCILLFIYRNLEVVNRLFCVLLLIVEKHTNIEIGLEVLGVRLQRLLVVLQALLIATLAKYCQLLDALRYRVEAIDVLWVQFKNLQVNLFLFKKIRSYHTEKLKVHQNEK